jgi:nicotinamidase-related amidase
MRAALLLIDVQKGMFTFRRTLHRGDDLLHSIGILLGRARAANVPIFHVQHNGGLGHMLAKGSIGWPHHPAVAPKAGETVIEKQHSSAFHETDFHARLVQSGVDRLIIAGIQTEYCVDSTCRAAAALAYDVVLVSDAHSTFDSSVFSAGQIIEHHNLTLSDGFVSLMRTNDVQF